MLGFVTELKPDHETDFSFCERSETVNVRVTMIFM